MSPSTDWRENIDGNEEQRFAAYAEKLAALQQAESQREGQGRALHRKQVLGLRAKLEVPSGLPAHAAQGLFARPGSYDVQIRLSNGSFQKQRDGKPDIRGFAFRVLGVAGAGALGATTKTQDFVLINREVFGFSKPDEFLELVLALFGGPLKALGLMIKKRGVFGGLKRLREISSGVARPFAGFAHDTFYSAAPISNGPHAVRVRLKPLAPGAATRADDRAAEMLDALARGPLAYELQLQFFVDEKTTPIEDGAVDWNEARAPYVTVATLTVPQQQRDEALLREIEAATFDPWEALAEHRPLGGIMRARKHAYFASQKARGVAS
jgi:hypothetical protein